MLIDTSSSLNEFGMRTSLKRLHIMIGPNNELYTDYDLFDSHRMIKRQMVGNHSTVFKYGHKKLGEIASQFDEIILLNPNQICDVHTIAYEIALGLVDDIFKIYPFVGEGRGKFTYNYPPLEMDFDEEIFNSIKALTSSEDKIIEMKWYRAFLYSFYKLWHNNPDKDYLASCDVSYDQNSSIDPIPPDTEYGSDNFNTLTMWLKYGIAPESVIEIFETTHGLVSPFHYDGHEMRLSSTRRAVECSFMVSKNLQYSDISHFTKYGSLVDGNILPPISAS